MTKTKFILFFCILTHTLFGQRNYEQSCQDLIQAAYFAPFNFENIESALKEVLLSINNSTASELSKCNCADSTWIVLLKDTRRFVSYTHSTKKDTNNYLRALPIILDTETLKQEFRFNELESVTDSFEYIIQRYKTKVKRRNDPPYNWMNYYHCVEAENEFIIANKYRLKNKYFKIFDENQNADDLRELIITSYLQSNQSIEDDILSRINAKIKQRYFYRMLGILKTSGTNKSVKHLLTLLKENDFELNEIKSILQTINGIKDRTSIKRKTKRDLKNYLIKNNLDSLSRYDLFIREK